MKKWPAVAFGALVAATVGAFFVTQHLKVTTPLIAGFPHPSPNVISPRQTGCGGQYRTARFSFFLLHRADTVAVYIVDHGGNIVRTLSSGRHMRRGVRKPDGEFPWDGRLDNGTVAPDGTYYYRIALLEQGQTVEYTNSPVTVQNEPPHPVITNVSPSLLPYGGAPARITYAGNENRGGTVAIYRTDLPGGPQFVKKYVTPWTGHTATWDGTGDGGRPAPAGTYLMSLRVTDAACNTGQFPPTIPPAPGASPHAGVTVRYLAAQPPLDPVPAGTSALVNVDARQHAYTWELRRNGLGKPIAHGSSQTFALRVPIPAKRGPGLYVLSLRSGGHRTAVPIVAGTEHGARSGRKILVVLPALTWQGLNPADDNGDGMPNTLEAGGPVKLQRPFVGRLPAGVSDEAAFLAYLDRAHLPYDLTTDLGLVDGVGPALSSHRGVVFAGAERWLPSALADELRTYAQGGGRVLSIGVDALRRSVTIVGGSAVDPSAPAASDIFGARPGKLVTGSRDPIIVIPPDDLGIFSTTSGVFTGYSTFQPFTAVSSPGGPVRSAAGTSSSTESIVGFAYGKGAVIEIGLPAFGASLSGSVDAKELVGQLWKVLGG